MRIIQVCPQLHLLQFPEVNDLAVYAWNDGPEVTLVDCGVPGSASLIEGGLYELGFTNAAVRRLVLTHGHPDHIGSAAQVRDWGAQVLVHRSDAAAVRGEPLPPPVLRDWELPVAAALPAIAPVPPTQVDRELDDGDTIDGFGGTARVISVPGHTAGSIAVHLPEHGILFTGDTLANVGGDTRCGVFNHDSDAVEHAVAALAAIDADIVCVGHGDVLTGDALARWRRDCLPAR